MFTKDIYIIDSLAILMPEDVLDKEEAADSVYVPFSLLFKYITRRYGSVYNSPYHNIVIPDLKNDNYYLLLDHEEDNRTVKDCKNYIIEYKRCKIAIRDSLPAVDEETIKHSFHKGSIKVNDISIDIYINSSNKIFNDNPA